MLTARAVAALLTLVTSAVQVGAQSQDSTRRIVPRDTAVTQLAPVEVIGSVLHSAGPAIASGIPARASLLIREEARSWKR